MNYINLLTFICMDGTLVFRKDVPHHIQIKISKERKIKLLEKLLNDSDITYTKNKATKSKLNKLQPYLYRIYGIRARVLFKLLDNKKEFPEWFLEMNEKEYYDFLCILQQTDGTVQNNRILWSTTNKINPIIVEKLCNKFNVKFNKAKDNVSGFTKQKIPKYTIYISIKCNINMV